jgi:hypothetical protein
LFFIIRGKFRTTFIDPYRATVEFVANLCALVFISLNYFSYWDRDTIENNSLVKQSSGRAIYSPSKK